MKLTTKFYGHFKILQKIGNAAYKLQLPDSANIHLVFHVSQLKKHVGNQAVPQTNLPLVTSEGYIKAEAISVLETRALPRGHVLVTQWKIQWLNLSKEITTWEDADFIKATFPEFYTKTLKEWWPTLEFFEIILF
ncbi:hypothetical protein PR202_ga24384 [Eleusine coracana subsp. coracana]|uniref:Tf2-1-like SH3-like domain-containing protein n=1 Tax=Eleusine coracana subsp. coracana TaxID=191504 RepID=A0AAV5D864_ELECO|nr:hypothetical protein PR202_ga24384 [Eleusine coracana subsp. coracana]